MDKADHRGHNITPAKREWQIKKVCVSLMITAHGTFQLWTSRSAEDATMFAYEYAVWKNVRKMSEFRITYCF